MTVTSVTNMTNVISNYSSLNVISSYSSLNNFEEGRESTAAINKQIIRSFMVNGWTNVERETFTTG